MAHVIVVANDDAFGTVQLSAPSVHVAENHVGPIINVTRTGGTFADVSVKFKALPITATAGKKRRGEEPRSCGLTDALGPVRDTPPSLGWSAAAAFDPAV